MSEAKFWDKAAAKYAKAPIGDMDSYVETRDRMRAILQPHHSVLELGCGTGSTALELADCAGDYLATDISPQMIAIAQGKRTDATPAHLRFAVQDAATLSAGTHNVVIALNLLHLVPDLENVIAQIYDALPQGGMLISKTGLLGGAPWYIRAAIPVARAVGKAPFVRTLSQTQLLDMFQTVGFQIDETLTQDGMVPRVFVVATKP